MGMFCPDCNFTPSFKSLGTVTVCVEAVPVEAAIVGEADEVQRNSVRLMRRTARGSERNADQGKGTCFFTDICIFSWRGELVP